MNVFPLLKLFSTSQIMLCCLHSMTLSNSFFPILLFCWLVIGSSCRGVDEPNQVVGDRYFYAGNNSLIGDIVSSLAVNATFPGFDFTGDPAIADSGISKNEWAWVVNVSDIELDNNYIVSQTTHTLRFPEQTFPHQNTTNWTACAYTFMTDIPQTLTSRVDTNNGSCAEVLGDACLAALVKGLQNRSPNRVKFPPGFVCPLPPFWDQLPECAAQIGYHWNIQPRMIIFSERLPSSTHSPSYADSSSARPYEYYYGMLSDPGEQW